MMARFTKDHLGPVAPPVYEKTLSDNDLKLSRLVLPNKCAEALFPELQGQHLMPISVLDTDGKPWEFLFSCCSKPTNTMYVLDGLRDYVIAQKWQAGDTVTFCKTKPGGKVMMGLRKTSAASST
ncbi:unnamed protein product [Cuscuta campestris]|uniref:TF-B3 domain-containing protein n=1 Tax=Cuscuta campestris TaxID=132261 RepID=A0A484MV43_9ASTE|nr:unnamed protein product [Cuscuta campestris]